MDDVVAAAAEHLGKADVGGGVEQHAVPLGAEDAHSGHYPAQHAVGVADVLPLQALDAVALPLPGENGVVVGVCGGEVAVGGVLRPADNGLRDRGRGGEAHVRHPHGDAGEALPDGGAGDGDLLGGDGVLPPENGGKVVGHRKQLLSRIRWDQYTTEGA